MIDAKILAEVYLQLKGGREQSLDFAVAVAAREEGDPAPVFAPRPPRPQPLPARLTAEEEAAHAAFVAGLGPNPLWLKLAS